jgi:hypothetical protein
MKKNEQPSRNVKDRPRIPTNLRTVQSASRTQKTPQRTVARLASTNKPGTGTHVRYGNRKMVTETQKARPYRIDKRHQHSTVISVVTDLKQYEKVQTIRFAPNMSIDQEHYISKNPNPDAISINLFALRILYYISTDMCYVYDNKRNYLGRLDSQDLKKVFNKIGAILRLRKHP